MNMKSIIVRFKPIKRVEILLEWSKSVITLTQTQNNCLRNIEATRWLTGWLIGQSVDDLLVCVKIIICVYAIYYSITLCLCHILQYEFSKTSSELSIPEEEFKLYKEKEENNIEKVEAIIYRYGVKLSINLQLS